MNVDEKYSVVSEDGDVGEYSLKELFSFSDATLLFFYPRDNTPGCTVENKDFSCMIKEFSEKGIALIGVSKDSVESHQKFIADHGLQLDLISDPDLVLHKELGAFGEKNNYGKIVQGVIRSTFLFDSDGNILQEWRNVRAKGHAEKVFRELII